MVNGQLIFENNSRDCDPKMVTRVDLKLGLPKTFFRECNKGKGDVYLLDITK